MHKIETGIPIPRKTGPTLSTADARAAIRRGDTFPDGLSVGGWLDLSGCTGLTALPDGLSVASLDLSGCTGIAAIPAPAKIVWRVYGLGEGAQE